MHKEQDSKWWLRSWLAFVDTLLLPSSNTTRNHTSPGWRIVRLDVDGSKIHAQLKNRKAECTDVTIAFTPLLNSQWAAVITEMARLYTSQRLEEQLPVELDQLFAQVGLTLFPATAAEIVQSCTCNHNHETLCLPLQKLYAAIGEMVAEDPWLLLQLRGRNRRQILLATQAEQDKQKSTQAETAYAVSPSPTNGKQFPLNYGKNKNEATDLIDEIDNFWGRRKEIESIQHHMSSPTIDLILLRRLGPPTGDDEGERLYDLLAKLYRQISEKALATAYATHDTEETLE